MGRSWSRADALDQVPVFTRLSAVWPALNSTSEAKCVASGPDGNPRTSRITENQNSDRRTGRASRDPFARWILVTGRKPSLALHERRLMTDQRSSEGRSHSSKSGAVMYLAVSTVAHSDQ